MPLVVRVPAPDAPVRTPARRRRARVAVLAGCALFLAAQLGMGVAVETVRPEWRDPEYGHRLKQLRDLHRTHPGRPLVVAVGSSRTQMGLSPAAMAFPDEPGAPLVYNFGQSGAGPLQLLLTVRRILDAGVRPDYLLVELFPVALIADGPAEQQLKTWAPRLNLGDLRRVAAYTDDPAVLRREWVANRAASWYSLRLSLMSHWLPGWLPWQQRLNFQWEQLDPYGWTPYPIAVVPDNAREAGIIRTRQQHGGTLSNYHVGATSDRALRDILDRCRGEGIPVAFYLTPESPAFRNWYAPPHPRNDVGVHHRAVVRVRRPGV